MFKNLELKEMVEVNGGLPEGAYVIGGLISAYCPPAAPAVATGLAVAYGIEKAATTPTPERTNTRGGVKHTVPAYRP